MNSRLLSSGNSDEAEGPNKQANSLIEIEREQSSETCGVHATLGGGTPLYGLYRYVHPKGYGFSAVLVINWVSILATFPPFWS